MYVRVDERSDQNAPMRSDLWHNMQFWEDLFCDTVAQERQLIGMDSSAEELLQRYKALAENEKRVLENDEDRLLSVIIYNLAAFMLLMQVIYLYLLINWPKLDLKIELIIYFKLAPSNRKTTKNAFFMKFYARPKNNWVVKGQDQNCTRPEVFLISYLLF